MHLVREERDGGVRILTIERERLLDDASLQGLYKEIVSPLDAEPCEHLVIDFQRVEFLSSAGLGMLIRIKKRCGDSGAGLHLCSMAPPVLEVLRLTGLDKMFDVKPSRSQAVAACSKS